MKIMNNLVTIAVAALLLTMASCGNKSTSENDSAVQAGNFFSSVAEKMQEQLGASLKASDMSLPEDERTQQQEKAEKAMSELTDAAASLGDEEITAETDGEFGLTLKGPFKVFMFNRENNCIYLLAPAEMNANPHHCYAIGYADDTPEYYIAGEENGGKDEEHMQMVMLTGEADGDEDTEYLQIKLLLRFTDAEQLSKVNKIVITQNKEIFNRLKTESEQRIENLKNNDDKGKELVSDDKNLFFQGISLGQTREAIVSQLNGKGFKTVQSNKYMTETQGTYYDKPASVSVEETSDNKIVVYVRETKLYPLKQAQQRLDELKPQVQGDVMEEILAWDTMEGYRFMQKGGKIELFYYNEDEVDGSSNYYIVAVRFCNQDFSE